jgi:hypothetical protein
MIALGHGIINQQIKLMPGIQPHNVEGESGRRLRNCTLSQILVTCLARILNKWYHEVRPNPRGVVFCADDETIDVVGYSTGEGERVF